METLEHFIVECRGLEHIRNREGMVGRSVEQILLFVTGEDITPDVAKRYIGMMWRERKFLLRGRLTSV